MKFKQHFDKIVYISKSTKWMSRGIWFDDNNILNHVVDVNDNFKTLTELPKEFEQRLKDNGWFGFKKD